MIALPNDHRDKIVCQSCGEVLRRRPMQTLGEALLVWCAILVPAVPLALFGGSAGIAITIGLLVFLLWVAPWQGLTYELSSAEGKDKLPRAKIMAALPPADPPGGSLGAAPPTRGDPPA